MPRISQKPNYSPHKRGRVWRLRSIGFSREDVARYERIPIGSVSGIATNVKSRVEICRVLAHREDIRRNQRRIIRIIDEDPFIQNRNLVEQARLRCSVSTLISHLRQWGVLHKRAIRRPKLTSEYAAARLRFAQEHRQKPINWWEKSFFSDKCFVARGDGDKTKWCFARKDERYNEDKVQLRAPEGRKTLLFWGAIGAFRKSALNVVVGNPDSPRGGVTARVILAMLQSELPTILEPGNIFMQDNASTHTAHSVQNWLRDFAQENGLQFIDWPPYSPERKPHRERLGIVEGKNN